MSQQHSGSRTNTRMSDYLGYPAGSTATGPVSSSQNNMNSGGGGSRLMRSNNSSSLAGPSSSSNGQTTSSSVADPWTKRNLVAQNVLMKHRAELEQMAAAAAVAASSGSRTGHHPHNHMAGSTTAAGGPNSTPSSIQLATAATPTPSKFLIPESSKYFKK